MRFMKLRVIQKIIATVLSSAAVTSTVYAAGPATKPASAAAAPALADLKPIQSVFILPHNAQEGRDPFYPKSTRPYTSGAPIIVSNAAPIISSVELKLKALSGEKDRRLALVNNHTFEAGEEAEVTTSSGRMRIRCLEIRPDSVVVQVGPERRELRLKGVL
jgi:hypothetical protein